MGIDRITKNEKRLDSINACIKNMEKALDEFKSNKKNLELLNKYYGSQCWFEDKDNYEKNRIPKVKAGVLSEDAIWNMNEELDELIKEMKSVVNWYLKKEKKSGV